MERHLAAILTVDVVGFSSLMSKDETGTLSTLQHQRKELFEPKTTQYGGRIVKFIGDGTLMEFHSVVDAVTFAVEIQCASKEHAPTTKIQYRIGINIGDVIEDDKDIYGDAVNIAARLEGLAEPNGICMSQNVFEQIKDKLDLTFEYLGERKVKSIEAPINVYCVKLDEKAESLVTPVVKASDHSHHPKQRAVFGAAIALLLAVSGLYYWQPWSGTEEPSIREENVPLANSNSSVAVLPFVNMSGDDQQEYFSDGMTEDLITDLSKISDVSVTSRSSTAIYKDRQSDVREIGKALNVQYVIEGSVRKVGDQVRINAQLLDATTGSHVWAERYDGSLNDIFGLQDQVLEKIVGSLAIKLSTEERENIEAHGTDSVVAHDLYLRGLHKESTFTQLGNIEAMDLYEQALSIDPDYALPYTRMSNILELSTRNGWSDDIRGDLEQAVKYAEKAAKLDPLNPSVHWSLGRATARLGTPEDLKSGTASMKRAIELDPDFADAYAYLTILYIADGRAEDGMRSLATAMRLNPNYPFWYIFMRGMAHYVTENYDAAIVDLEAALERSPTAQFVQWWLAASYAQIGDLDEAEWQVDEMIMNGFEGTISTILGSQPIQDPEYIALYIDGLRKAGIPE